MAKLSIPPKLDKPVYQMNQAARLLRLPDKTLRRWIDGDRRFEKVIEPLIRSARGEIDRDEFEERRRVLQS